MDKMSDVWKHSPKLDEVVAATLSATFNDEPVPVFVRRRTELALEGTGAGGPA
jgi:hypothetical protein